eukprot:358031-Chlamydomonas_euryale.AAC.5
MVERAAAVVVGASGGGAAGVVVGTSGGAAAGVVVGTSGGAAAGVVVGASGGGGAGVVVGASGGGAAGVVVGASGGGAAGVVVGASGGGAAGVVVGASGGGAAAAAPAAPVAALPPGGVASGCATPLAAPVTRAVDAYGGPRQAVSRRGRRARERARRAEPVGRRRYQAAGRGCKRSNLLPQRALAMTAAVTQLQLGTRRLVQGRLRQRGWWPSVRLQSCQSFRGVSAPHSRLSGEGHASPRGGGGRGGSSMVTQWVAVLRTAIRGDRSPEPRRRNSTTTSSVEMVPDHAAWRLCGMGRRALAAPRCSRAALLGLLSGDV